MSLCTLYGMRGGEMHKNIKYIFKKLCSILLHRIFSCYYSSIDIKRQWKHLGLCPDTSSLAENCFRYEK